MPTENQSSNTENAACPFCGGQVDPLGWLRGDGVRGPECENCSATAPTLALWNRARTALQGQGKPVAYQIRSKTDRPGSQWKPWRECCDNERALHGHEVGRFNQHGIIREIRPVFASATDPAEVEQLRAENERLSGLKPEWPPRPPAGDGLPRYGLRWNGSQQPIAVPMDDGYWTPWHLADRIREDRDGLLEGGAHAL